MNERVFFKKEWQEGGAVVLLISFFLTIGWTFMASWWHWMEPEDEHFVALFLNALFSGVLVATLQVHVERSRGTWPYLLHRGTSPRAVLAAKRRVGLLFGLLLVPMPTLLAYHLRVLAAPELWNLPRVLELVAVGAWFVPAYAIAQWQALSNADRRGEVLHRVALSIALAGAPFAFLAELDEQAFAAPVGWWALVVVEVLLAGLGFALANRRFDGLPARARILPRGEAILTGLAAAALASLLVASIGFALRKGPKRFLERGRSAVLVDAAGRIATWRAAGREFELVARDGTVVHRAKRPSRRAIAGWREVRERREVERDERRRLRRRAPFALRSWHDLGGVWPERAPDERASRAREVFLLLPSGRVVTHGREADGGSLLDAPGPDGSPLVVSPYVQSHPVTFDEHPDEGYERGVGVALFEPGDRELVVLCGATDVRTTTLPGGDAARYFRVERVRREGRSDDTFGVLVGDAGEYLWSPEAAAFEPFVDETPGGRSLVTADPFALVADLDGAEVERVWATDHGRGAAACWVHLTTLVRAPLGSVVSALVPPRPYAERHALWTHALDWNVAGGRRPLVLAGHLLLGVLLAAWVARHLRGRENRGLWVLVTLLFGVAGLLVVACETRGRKDPLALEG